MKDALLGLASTEPDPTQRLNLLREYLQAFVLRSLHESEAFASLAFVGGTALRFLFDLPRYSEDLDFSLSATAGYSPVRWMEKLKRDLVLADFRPTVTWNDRKVVHVGWVRVAEVLKGADLASMASENLSIKLEIDTRPPAGAETEVRVVTRHMMFAIRHHSLPSLMAGKLHALITRHYPKGRDWYDLLWYRSRRPVLQPNLALLQNALDQTQGPGRYAAADWPSHVSARLATLDLERLRPDVEPFLERPPDIGLLTAEHLRSAIDLPGLGAE